MVNHHCAALNCTNTRKKRPGMTFVRFPKDQARCNVWIQNAKRPDLQKVQAEYLYKHAILCEEHFEDSQWMNKNMKHLGLIHTATPTIFQSGSSPSQTTPKQRSRKRRERVFKSEFKVNGILVKGEPSQELENDEGNFHFSGNEVAEEEPADILIDKVQNEPEKLKVQASQQRCHKINASIVNMGGDQLYLVLPVPSTTH